MEMPIAIFDALSATSVNAFADAHVRHNVHREHKSKLHTKFALYASSLAG